MIRITLTALVAMLALSCAIAPPPGPIVVMRGDDTNEVTFRFAVAEPHQHVYLTGEFLGWNPTAREMTDEDGDGVYETTISLPNGRHLYKFTIDGNQWLPDPENPRRTVDEYENSILYIGVQPPERVETSEPPPVEAPQAWLPNEQQTAQTSQEHPTVLLSLPDDGYDEVFVTGDFNDWTGQRDQLTLNAALGEWQIPLAIPLDACVAYRFVVTRGEETFTMRDPAQPHITFDGHPVDSVLLMPSNTDNGVVFLLSESFESSRGDLLPRPISVWLPPGGGSPPIMDIGREVLRYPVLYMHDGQNVFDDPVNPFGHGGWHVNTTAEELINAGTIEPFIIVAVGNTEDRFQEYGPGPDVMHAEAQPYVRFLIEDVMPVINARFRTETGPENTALMGSSMGGLISFLGAYEHPDVFGSAACLSTAFLVSDEIGQHCADLVSAEGKRPIRVYLDSGNGGNSQDGAPRTREMRDVMIDAGWTLGDDLVWYEEEGAIHNERAWRARVWRPLMFLYGEDE